MSKSPAEPLSREEIAKRVFDELTRTPIAFDGTLSSLEASYLAAVRGSREPAVGRISHRSLAKIKASFMAQQRFYVTAPSGLTALKFYNALLLADRSMPDDRVDWDF